MWFKSLLSRKKIHLLCWGKSLKYHDVLVKERKRMLLVTGHRLWCCSLSLSLCEVKRAIAFKGANWKAQQKIRKLSFCFSTISGYWELTGTEHCILPANSAWILNASLGLLSKTFHLFLPGNSTTGTAVAALLDFLSYSVLSDCLQGWRCDGLWEVWGTDGWSNADCCWWGAEPDE